jgi:hypothetical protein
MGLLANSRPSHSRFCGSCIVHRLGDIFRFRAAYHIERVHEPDSSSFIHWHSPTRCYRKSIPLSYLILANESSFGRCCTTSHCTLKQSKVTAPSRPVLQSSRKHSPWHRLPSWLELLSQSPEAFDGQSGQDGS